MRITGTLQTVLLIRSQRQTRNHGSWGQSLAP